MSTSVCTDILLSVFSEFHLLGGLLFSPFFTAGRKQKPFQIDPTKYLLKLEENDLINQLDCV